MLCCGVSVLLLLLWRWVHCCCWAASQGGACVVAVWVASLMPGGPCPQFCQQSGVAFTAQANVTEERNKVNLPIFLALAKVTVDGHEYVHSAPSTSPVGPAFSCLSSFTQMKGFPQGNPAPGEEGPTSQHLLSSQPGFGLPPLRDPLKYTVWHSRAGPKFFYKKLRNFLEFPHQYLEVTTSKPLKNAIFGHFFTSFSIPAGFGHFCLFLGCPPGLDVSSWTPLGGSSQHVFPAGRWDHPGS